MILVGNYYISLKMGDVDVPISPQMIDSIVVTTDMDRLLPTFRITVKDATGLLGEVIPYDKNLNEVELGFARGDNPDDVNTFKLLVKRRKPDSDKKYQIEGVLNVPSLLTDVRHRSLTGNIKSNIELLAREDLGINSTEIGQSLNYDKTLIQPGWTDAKLLRYLFKNISGKNGETCYYCFIKNVRGVQTLVMKSLDELLSGPVKSRFIVSHKQYEDLFPIVEYKIFDNSQLIVDLGAKNQTFGYFDYNSGKYVYDSLSIDDCPALAEKTLIDNNNGNDSVFVSSLGRTNGFTTDFHGRVGGSFYDRANGLINMWISTYGMEQVSPGYVVNVIFGESLVGESLFLYQHSGYWLVKRASHVLSSSFMTNLLLTRNGIDTSLDTSLIASGNLKRK